MAHTCSFEGCDRPVFAKSFCAYHQYMRKKQGGDLHKRKPRKEPIARRTKKREKDERQYKDHAREFFDNAVATKTNKCFFCDEFVTFFQGLHHLKGRTNDYLNDKEWWVIVHNDCHVYKYHAMDYEHKQQLPWWGSFLDRLKLKSDELWRKETRKEEKAHKLNPKLNLFNDNDYDQIRTKQQRH